MVTEQARAAIGRLMREQRLCVLATDNGGQPYGSLVAFASSEDLAFLLFATARETRKYSYLSSQPKVALVIDNRSNEESDFRDAAAVTALGNARETLGDERIAMAELYLDKHPYLREFVESPECALVRVDVERYVLATRFQSVTEFVPGR